MAVSSLVNDPDVGRTLPMTFSSDASMNLYEFPCPAALRQIRRAASAALIVLFMTERI